MGYSVLSIALVPFTPTIILIKFGFYVTAGILMSIPLKGELRLAELTHVLGLVVRLMGSGTGYIHTRVHARLQSAALHTSMCISSQWASDFTSIN